MINNLIFDKRFSIPQTIVSVFVSFIGAARIFNRNDNPFFDFIKLNFSSLAQILFGLGITIGIFQFIISFYKNEVMNIQKDKMKIQEEVG